MSASRFATFGVCFGAAIGAVVVLGLAAAVAWVDRVSFFDKMGEMMPVQIAFVAAPFVVLALADVRAKSAWLVALGLTVTFWGFVFYVVAQPYSRGDANIGLGLLMLVSPVVILAASFAGRRIEIVLRRQ